MSRTRIVNGKYTKVTEKGYNLYSEGNTNINALGLNNLNADKDIHHGSAVEKAPAYQPKDSVNIFIGMFFDGTGNNRYNSDKTYYSKINSGETYYKNDTVPQEYYETIKDPKTGKQKKIKISDRDSYWNPYSNVAKLFDLYKEKKNPSEDAKGSEDAHPEYGNYAILKQYVEGIGTKQDKEDDIAGSCAGRGDWGVIGRVEEGIKNVIANEFSSIPKDKKINKIVFDVFGFSRGAAAARHFCNEVKKSVKYDTVMRDEMDTKMGRPKVSYVSVHAGGLFGKRLIKAGYQPVGDTFSIEIRFLGVFDTVISDMVVKENIGYKVAGALAINPLTVPYSIAAFLGQASLEKINTKVSGLGIKKIFHITAHNEWRKNFALTPTEEGYTISMLGAHSDIGGGYAHLDKYTAVLDYFDVKVGDDKILKEKEKIRQFYINQRISTEKEIVFRNTYDHVKETTITSAGVGTREIKAEPDFPDKEKTVSQNPYYQIFQTKESDHYILEDSRYISNKYSLVAMYMMLQKAIDNKVPFYDDYKIANPKVPHEFEYEIPETDKYKVLKQYMDLMLEESKKEGVGNYTISSEIYQHICNHYIHLSANFGGLAAIGVKTGDHHILESVGFVNQPVAPKVDKDGNIYYEREKWYP
ncbi:phospholipase effector Tle1 domain-containing protein [Chryseobacterium sp. PMSZPI]|uniref:phospholipase effector Tle1 domain-containing protein n=1 Tax=Chryseobacterium sp. PMSZPI TaxID=1033900 RepID=UPI000C327982|nr:DUF2235 domain-containing protein [Chryseobacterium sp. PMSZPI]PKF75839.1 hypothetical protein CW752_01995 [Chryseobacterium sp. PMSZPI]